MREATEDSAAERRTTLLVRVWLPDRPGALGAVASRIGSVGGDVHEIEVVDRGAGRAVDELVVTVPSGCPLDLLAREIDEIDGVDVEELQPIPTVPPDPRMQAFGAALALTSAEDGERLAEVLVEQARTELRADHVAVVCGDRIVAAGGEGPTEAWLVAFARGVAGDAGGSGPGGGQAEDVAWTAVPGADWTLVVSRASTGLRDRERRVLVAMGELAGALFSR